MFRITLGKLPQWMVDVSKKRPLFYSENGTMLKSDNSKVDTDKIRDGARSIAAELKNEPADLIDFIIVSVLFKRVV